MSTIPVFVTRGGGQPVIIHIAHGAFVGDLVKTVIAELKLKVTADRVLLRFAPSGAGEPGVALNPRKTLSEAGVGEKSDLVIEVIFASAVGACIKGESSLGLFSEGLSLEGQLRPLRSRNEQGMSYADEYLRYLEPCAVLPSMAIAPAPGLRGAGPAPGE